MTESPTFDSAWRKLKRARHHYEMLQRDLDRWTEDAIELDWVTAYNGNRRIVASVVQPISEAVIGSMEDTLASARVSLERVVHEVVEARYRGRCKFPIWSDKDSATWRQQVKAAAPGQQATWLRDQIEALEPWPGGRDAWLYWLHHLNIADKHRDGFTAVAAEKERTVTTLVERVHPDVWQGSEARYMGEAQVTFVVPDPAYPLREGQLLQEFKPEQSRTITAYSVDVFLAFGPKSGLDGEPVIRWTQRMLESLTSLLQNIAAPP